MIIFDDIAAILQESGKGAIGVMCLIFCYGSILTSFLLHDVIFSLRHDNNNGQYVVQGLTLLSTDAVNTDSQTVSVMHVNATAQFGCTSGHLLHRNLEDHLHTSLLRVLCPHNKSS